MVSENRYVTFGNKHIGFSISIYRVASLAKFKDVILERSYVVAVLNQGIRVNKVLKVAFELTKGILPCCLDVVNR